MSTDISMQTRAYQVDDRRWLLAEPDVKLNRTLDPTKFTAGTHYPNGYLPSGTVIGKVTATGLYGPYDDTASDGRQTADGLTYGSATFIRQDGSTAAKVGISAVVYDTVVSVGKLPFQSGAGAIDANGKADLAQIRWEA
jgi:hypothetical protein